jgi:hypothetical protein
MIQTLRIRDFLEILQCHAVLGIHFASSARLRIGRVTSPTGPKKCTNTLRTSSNVESRHLKNEHGWAINTCSLFSFWLARLHFHRD